MITAIIVNYFSSHLAAQAVQSLLDSSQTQGVDIWLVDNSDCQSEALNLENSLPSCCRLIINEQNVGFAKACNQVYEKSAGDWILLLNPDARLFPDALIRLRTFLTNNPRAGAAAPRVYWDDAHEFLLPPSIFPSPWQDTLWHPKGRLGGGITWMSSLQSRANAKRYWTAKKPLLQKNLSGGHVLLRRSAVDSAGGLFDERFFLYYEDTDLFLRLRRAGYQLYTLPSALATHAFSGCAREKINSKNQHMAVSHVKFFEKYYKDNSIAGLIGTYLSSRKAPLWRPTIMDLGILDAPPTFQVFDSWQDAWLMELSPNPYFMPAAGHFGQGATAEIPSSVWPILLPGKSFVRLGPRDGYWVEPKVWQWETKSRL